MKIKRLITAVAAGVAVLSMSACSAHPGVAFIIDGKEYRTSEVEKAAKELSQITGQPVSPATVIDFVSRLETAKQMAADNGISLTVEEVKAGLDKEVNNPENQQFKNVQLPLSELTVDTFFSNALLNQVNQQVGQQAFKAEFLKLQREHKLEVNPRFGSVSESGTLAPLPFIGVVDGAAQPANQ